ncbi:Inner membrane permease YgbN [Thalassoglobus neptunius]|uniref:Inner membrane permease YgbN n=1 Tax=Thalassoglobus neptunius TaxID=1938619 RepID=A0A5C5X4S9_9PLAN|nr:SLC13 family permease [Thalassoglobus neptunius]TWT58117.1 Inner membrane permease YgbN [Thalassoglobus neptunius]
MLDSTWGTVFILLVGVCIVVGSILIFRLHAFLALVAAALVVAFLTPDSTRQRYLIENDSFVVHVDDDQPDELRIHGATSAELPPGSTLSVVQLDPKTHRYQVVGTAKVLSESEPGLTVVQAEFLKTSDVTVDDQLLLRGIFSNDLRSVNKELRSTIGAQVASGFGSTCSKIGILIAMAAIIGKCLLDSGAADRIVRTTLRLCGEPAAPVAFTFSGFFLGIPVFFDTVFYLMIPLGKAMRLRTRKNYLLYVLTIVCGATMAHSLVPPTPGPLLVAEELGVDLGVMILVGTIVGLFCAVYGYIYALIINARCELPLRDSPDFSLAELEESLTVDESQLPGFWMASLPILMPVILIAGHTLVSHPSFPIDLSMSARRVIETLGDKNIALLLSAVIAMGVLIRQKRTSFEDLSKSIQSALASGGVIILITAAGGAFGQVLRQTGIADLIQNLPDASPQVICTLAFLITTAIRTAQGSASVAMITSAGILSGIALDGGLPFEPVYLACAIGAGSKPIAWMNDSGFWVITKMSGMSEAEGLKYITPMTASMGVVGLLVVLVGVTFYPNF